MFLLWTLGPATLFAIGNLLQKVGLGHAATVTAGQGLMRLIQKVFASGRWWLGIAISAVATILYYGALAKYNISLVQLMMSLNPVLTALGGWLILKEHLDRRTALAIVFVMAGIAFAGLLAGEDSGHENVQRLWLFTLLMAGVLMVFRFVVRQFEVRKSVIGGVCFGLSAVFMKSLTGLPIFQSEIGVDLLFDFQVMSRFGLFVATYLAGFSYTQMGMTQGRALFIVPLSSALGMLVPSLAGILVFGEPISWGKATALIFVTIGSLLFVRTKH